MFFMVKFPLREKFFLLMGGCERRILRMKNQSTRQIIEKLLVVQKLDMKIARCNLELEDIPHAQKAIETAAESRSGALETAKEGLKTAKAAVRKLEVEIDTERQHIKKLKEQQFQIKSNTEYKALNQEIASAEEKIGGVEDREIELMEQVERAETKVAAAEGAIKGDQGRAKLEIAALDQRRAGLDAELKQLQGERDAATNGIDASWLARYNLVMKKKSDLALAGMDESGTCGACHMKLTPQLVNDVKKEAAMISCSFCGRLLYWTE